MSAVARHRTTANSCVIAKSRALRTVHRGRLIRSRQDRRDQRQYWHCPRLFTRCCLSSMRAIARSRTASSLTASGSGGSFPSSLASQCCSCSLSNRYRISATELTVSGQAPRDAWMRTRVAVLSDTGPDFGHHSDATCRVSLRGLGMAEMSDHRGRREARAPVRAAR